MQCFTREHKYPRTTSGQHFTAPPISAYKKRRFFVPEPDRIGRPWCPDGVVMTPPWGHIKTVMFNPVYDLHRESHIEEMLPFINKTNWTCGQDMKNFGSRKSKLSDSNHYSMQTTYRSAYSGHWMGHEPRRNPERIATPGITPTTLHVQPYDPSKCPFIVNQPLLPSDDPKTRCQRMSVPHYILEPYPGPQLPENLIKKPQVKTVETMGLVQ